DCSTRIGDSHFPSVIDGGGQISGRAEPDFPAQLTSECVLANHLRQTLWSLLHGHGTRGIVVGPGGYTSRRIAQLRATIGGVILKPRFATVAVFGKSYVVVSVVAKLLGETM